MKKLKLIRQRLKDHWRGLMDSTQLKMSRGGQKVFKIISWARRDNWRRKNHKKPKNEE